MVELKPLAGGTATHGGSAMPRLSGGWPFLGHLTEFQEDPIAMLLRGAAENGDLFQFNLGPKRFALFSGPTSSDAPK